MPVSDSNNLADRPYSNISPTHYVRVLRPALPVRIDNPDPEITCYVGNSLPIFQESDKYLIGIVDTKYTGTRLCAFPAENRNGYVAWCEQRGYANVFCV